MFVPDGITASGSIVVDIVAVRTATVVQMVGIGPSASATCFLAYHVTPIVVSRLGLVDNCTTTACPCVSLPSLVTAKEGAHLGLDLHFTPDEACIYTRFDALHGTPC